MQCIHCKKSTVCTPVICRECYDGLLDEITGLRTENREILRNSVSTEDTYKPTCSKQDADEFMRQLRIVAIERRPEACLGCGFEHNCSVQGCAVIEKVIKILNDFDKSKSRKLLERISVLEAQLAISTKKKPIYMGYDDEPICPNCREILDDGEEHCGGCDQRIDWRDLR